MNKIASLGFFLFCLCSILVSAEELENQTPNILLSTNLEKNYYLNINFDHLFAVDKQVDCSEKDKVTVLYNISKNNALIKEELFTRDLNSCTKVSASTGDFTPIETGNYTLCGIILNSTVGENNSFYNQVCTPFEVIDTSSLACDIDLHLNTNETIFYEHGQSIKFKPELNDKSFPFVIEYWIEDLFGNIVKPKINTTNTNQKSWKTNIKEQDRVLFLKAIAYPNCDDADLSGNAAEKMFIVKKDGSDSSLPPTGQSAAESTLSITKISPESVSFGETLDAEVEIYKGATNKYSVSLWVEKDGKVISEKTKIHVKSKNIKYKFTVPILLDANCNEKIKDGDVQLVVEGLGLQEEKEFAIKGINEKLCPENDKKTEKSVGTKKQVEKTESTGQSLSLLSQSDDSLPSLITEKAQKKEVAGYEGIVVYQSVSEQSKNLASWVLFVAFGLLSLVLALIIKRD